MKNDNKNGAVAELARRKQISRDYLRAMSPTQKVAKLVELQEHYFEMLKLREQNGGRPMPERWKKWYAARHPE